MAERSTPFFFHRTYWLVQAVAVALWWPIVFTWPEVRRLTLGSLPGEIIYVDVLLLVVGGWLAARSSPKRIAVGAGMLIVAWLIGAGVWTWIEALRTPDAGLGAVLMGLAALASMGTLLAQMQGGIPWAWLIVGPFRFRTTPEVSTGSLLVRTGSQIAAFWSLFLVVLPWLVRELERLFDLQVAVMHHPAVAIAGWTLFAVAGVIGLACGVTMSTRGAGTPLPARQSRNLVVAGPYRFVRNPMALTGIVQGAAVGLTLGSWLVVVYALIGSLGWNGLIRPAEEADLRARFGAEFDAYARARAMLDSAPPELE